MPKYKKKITRQMDYDEFKEAIAMIVKPRDRAFLTLLFFAGCRISEALALTPDDIDCKGKTIYVHFTRLKGSQQTDPQQLPNADALRWLCFLDAGEKPFPFSRTTGYRLVRRAFEDLYPHYFRMNRITKVSNEFSDATVYHIFGICASSIDHYRAKVDIQHVGRSLQKEIEG